jgi:predicted RNA binding protein YcfA (HicA-like mRNA interferase family)
VSYATIASIARARGDSGFATLRIKGSHHFMRHSDGRVTVVPVHSGETIGPGLLRKILKDIEMEPQQFQNWL